MLELLWTPELQFTSFQNRFKFKEIWNSQLHSFILFQDGLIYVFFIVQNLWYLGGCGWVQDDLDVEALSSLLLCGSWMNEWNNGWSMNIIVGQKSAKIRILHFLAYLALFWPEIMEFD